jgi:hypothetical protein
MTVDANEWASVHRSVCARYGAPHVPFDFALKVGISVSVREKAVPVHGLRHRLDGDTSGWYIWSGELSEDPNFFVPLHARHLVDWQPRILQYLGLPPGWRFLWAPDHEDVWEDPMLLVTG